MPVVLQYQITPSISDQYNSLPQTQSQNFPLGGGTATSDFDVTTTYNETDGSITTTTGNYGQQGVVRSFLPAGEYQGTATGSMNYSASIDNPDDWSSTHRAAYTITGTNLSGAVQTALFYEAEFTANFTTAGTQAATIAGTPDNYATAVTLLAPKPNINNSLLGSASITRAGIIGTGGAAYSGLTRHTYSTLDVRFRPVAALSKTATLRFATVEYLDGGVPKIDYFTIPDSFILTKVTATYPSAPTVNTNDPAQFWTTKTYNGSTPGDSFTINNGLVPNPAFNVSASGDLIAFPGFDDDLSIYAGNVTLTRDINGTTSEVKARGLGLTPDRILAVGDVA
ncbi:MAG: hypothetical protein AAF959_29425 [Cyanobacteria bacterium P01_D01_bin.56]